MSIRGPLVGMAALVAVVAIGVVAGSAVGVGPLAATTPPDQVSDPEEMIARSIQSILDAQALHLEATITGTVPGALLGRDEAATTLDGTAATADVLPRDAKSQATVVAPALGVTLDTVSVWDGVWYRTADGGPWTRASIGALSADAGLDINPLTLVDRVREYLDRPGMEPSLEDVPCAGVSGRCHRLVLDTGTDLAGVIGALVPDDRAGALPPVSTTVTVDTDASTLRPAALVLDVASEDGTVDLRLAIDVSRWDEPVFIEEPASGS